MPDSDEKPINLPATIAHMAAVERFKFTLFPMTEARPIAHNEVLIPDGALASIVAELDNALKPMTFEQAKVEAARLVAFFPNTAAKSSDWEQQVFLTGLMEILMTSPFEVGRKAVDWLKNNRAFLNQSDLSQACDRQMTELRRAKGIALAHQREATRRAQEVRDEFDLSSRFTTEELEAQRAEVQAGLADLAARLKKKAGPSYEAQAETRKATLRAMTPEEFKADTDAMMAKMRAEEPAYLERMAKANKYVMDLKAKRAGGRSAG